MDSDSRPVSAGPPVPAGPSEAAPDIRRQRIFDTRSILFVLICGILGYFVFAVLSLTGPGNSPAAEPVMVQQAPAATAPAATTPTSTPTPTAILTPAAPAGPAAAPPRRLVYPAANIDVVIHPLQPSGSDQASQTIVPPPTMDGYWLTPYGVPGVGSSNTTYVAGHSWTDRDAPFNRLSTKAAAGDRFTVSTATGELAYRVDSVTTYKKSGLKDSPIWQVVPNRLVLISCYTDDFWGTNVVVVASPAPNVAAR